MPCSKVTYNKYNCHKKETTRKKPQHVTVNRVKKKKLKQISSPYLSLLQINE